MMNDPFEILEALSNQYRKAVLEMPPLRPWVADDKKEILQQFNSCLGITDELTPSVSPQLAWERKYETVRVQGLTAETWAGCQATSHLYLPAKQSAQKIPLVIIYCGHGTGGKQAPAYQALAWRLANSGVAALISDNIGQGERRTMGHPTVIAPFAAGCSLQGLIAMEALAWMDWALADKRFDTDRVGIVGNSGGGLLSLIIGALRSDDLSVVVSTGYPSSFEFISRKEKRHCRCNILPGIVGTIEMWQLYGCIAPTQLFLLQGNRDELFPIDIFHENARKVDHCYKMAGLSSGIDYQLYPGEHSWDDTRIPAIEAYLVKALGLQPRTSPLPVFEPPPNTCFAQWPEDALTTDAFVTQLFGIDETEGKELHDVYFPELNELPNPAVGRGTFYQVAGQMQALLAPEFRLKLSDR